MGSRCATVSSCEWRSKVELYISIAIIREDVVRLCDSPKYDLAAMTKAMYVWGLLSYVKYQVRQTSESFGVVEKSEGGGVCYLVVRLKVGIVRCVFVRGGVRSPGIPEKRSRRECGGVVSVATKVVSDPDVQKKS
jgi:hypothetical protein